jgi:hypothetical protein
MPEGMEGFHFFNSSLASALLRCYSTHHPATRLSHSCVIDPRPPATPTVHNRSPSPATPRPSHPPPPASAHLVTHMWVRAQSKKSLPHHTVGLTLQHLLQGRWPSKGAGVQQVIQVQLLLLSGGMVVDLCGPPVEGKGTENTGGMPSASASVWQTRALFVCSGSHCKKVGHQHTSKDTSCLSEQEQRRHAHVYDS